MTIVGRHRLFAMKIAGRFRNARGRLLLFDCFFTKAGDILHACGYAAGFALVWRR
jgi:hypothetical protein